MTSPGRELRVVPEDLKRGGKGFEDGSDAVKQAGSRLETALQAEGRCWGNDDTGQQFEQGYLQNAQDVVQMFKNLSENIAGIKKGIDRMAKTFTDAEDASAGR